MFLKNYDMYYGIQLGCFNQPAEGWYNTDITPHILISKIYGLPFILNKVGKMTNERYLDHKTGIFKKVHYLNLLNKLPFNNNSINAYFSSHVLEHLPLEYTKSLLKEIFRTLKVKGYLRLVLPDLEYAISIYNKTNPEPFLKMIFENQTSPLSKNQHKWMYTFPYMKNLLNEVGFTNILKLNFKQSNYLPFIDLDNRPGNSFYIEAQKLL